MKFNLLRFGVFAVVLVACAGYALHWAGFGLPGSADLKQAKQDALRRIETEIRSTKVEIGTPVFLRIFKQSSELEVWVKADDRYELLKTFPICRYSGELGPKLKEGDGQSPEGFYKVAIDQLNPNSKYHLSFNLGFPNAYDRVHSRTGSYLMVHGNCVSIGCYAMTNSGIEEIYLLVEAALKGGQGYVSVHIFPFRMTAKNMAAHQNSQWVGFWRNLKQGYDYFEKNRTPPLIDVSGRSYVVKDAI